MEKKKVELLAPAGRWDALTAVIEAGADAVYIGGKRFNMRLHRSDFNFTDEQIAMAVQYAHSKNVKLYVTVNNLLCDEELEEVTHFLDFLNDTGTDAVVVQDLGVLRLIRKLNIPIPVHISTMANIHNTESALTMKELGVNRIVTSRDISLEMVKAIHEKTGIGVEYFVHGDLCICQSGQCYASGILFGKSSNRGECMKPCRWHYTLVDSASGKPLGNVPSGYFLAMKDMCLINHIPDLVSAGVCSFKIEGRMRDADFLGKIVDIYRRAIDSYLNEPISSRMVQQENEQIYKLRIRDFTTSLAFAPASASVVDPSGCREPLFLSRAAKEKSLEEPDIHDNPFETFSMTIPGQGLRFVSGEYENSQPVSEGNREQCQLLSVKVASMGALKAALSAGADRIYICAEFSRYGGHPWTKALYKEACNIVHNAGKAIGIGSPRITTDYQMSDIAWLFDQASYMGFDYVLVHNLGTLRMAAGLNLKIIADYSFNILNTQALYLLKELGVHEATVSIEGAYRHLKQLACNAPLPIECIVHGPVSAMILEHCIPAMVISKSHRNDHCRQVCRYLNYALKDEHGEIRSIEIDQYCRNHILLAKDVCVLPYLQAFVRTWAGIFRIEGQYYEDSLIEILVRLYRQYLNIYHEHPDLFLPVSPDEWNLLVEKSPRGFSLGGYAQDITLPKSTAKVMRGIK